MKYIISENQFNSIIDNFLTFQFEPHEKVVEKIYPNFESWMRNDVQIAGVEGTKYFFVREDIWEDIANMFSLDYDDVEHVIRKWLETKYGLGKLTPRRFFVNKD
jgi:hypothetical protein